METSQIALTRFSEMPAGDYRGQINELWSTYRQLPTVTGLSNTTTKVAQNLLDVITDEVEAERITPLQGLTISESVLGHLFGLATANDRPQT